jgi:hypothetical protein
MFRRVVLASAAAAAIAGGAVAAPAAAHASIYQPNCWGRTVKCLVAMPGLKYQAIPPGLKYGAQVPPGLKYGSQAQPNNVWEDGG